jgi:hypothetical protein
VTHVVKVVRGDTALLWLDHVRSGREGVAFKYSDVWPWGGGSRWKERVEGAECPRAAVMASVKDGGIHRGMRAGIIARGVAVVR